MTTFTLAFDDHDSYYELDDHLVPQLAELPLEDMLDFVVDNGKPVKLGTSETDFWLCQETDYVDEVEEEELREELRSYQD